MKQYAKHQEGEVIVNATAPTLFTYLDDHSRLSSHMNKSSLMMGGGHMDTSIDEGKGQKVGSHIRLAGKAFGIKIFLDEIVTQHEPPSRKTWETVGDVKLLVIGEYKMTFEIKPQGNNSLLNVSIDYDLPTTWLGYLFSGFYAKWCVQKMLKDAQRYFI